jgi:hypothetical protein
MREDSVSPASADALTDYFRCPAGLVDLLTVDGPWSDDGFFAFGDAVGYGKTVLATPATRLTDRAALPSVTELASVEPGVVTLPFDLSAVVTNLREERYRLGAETALDRLAEAPLVRALYYLARPALPVFARRPLQKIRLGAWQRIPFPQWPVDSSVDDLMRQVLALATRATGLDRLPFIWFWPDGARAGGMVTHDVESAQGCEFSDALMDLDDSFGVKAAFQLIPEPPERFDWGLVERIRARHFEVNVHDLNHDGHLFHERERFLARAAKINGYLRDLQSRGFRSGAMYRNQQWFDALDVAYDMSVPNVAHLEPQRGGCCTVMPYFVGGLLELPLTTVQDYSLFHILNEYSTDLWDRQIDKIASLNGLITILTHPDYLGEPRARMVYRRLLARLTGMRDRNDVWLTTPGEVDRWWRNRAQMRLVKHGSQWRIEGADSGRARVAYASLAGERVVYSVSGSA